MLYESTPRSLTCHWAGARYLWPMFHAHLRCVAQGGMKKVVRENVMRLMFDLCIAPAKELKRGKYVEGGIIVR